MSRPPRQPPADTLSRAAAALLTGAALFLISGAARAAPITIATWNMGWLTTRPASDTSLPPGIYRRTDADIDRLARWARHLNADVIAFQEVDGPTVAARVFPPDQYQLFLSGDPIVQETGVAVRKGLTARLNPVLTELNVYPPTAPHQLRSGLDITITRGSASLRLLVVHLKTGCWENTWTERQHACPTLRSQISVLDNWALERQDSGEPFAILGDFNRRLEPADPYFLALTTDSPMTLTTAGKASPCWGGEYFIDHILLGGTARSWLVPDSLRVMTYGTSPDATPAQLSDHCPVSVRLSLPDSPATP